MDCSSANYGVTITHHHIGLRLIPLSAAITTGRSRTVLNRIVLVAERYLYAKQWYMTTRQIENNPKLSGNQSKRIRTFEFFSPVPFSVWLKINCTSYFYFQISNMFNTNSTIIKLIPCFVSVSSTLDEANNEIRNKSKRLTIFFKIILTIIFISPA